MKLTPTQQKIVDLRHAHDPPLSWNEIARQLGTTKGHVSAAYSRAMRRLDQPEPKYRKVRADAVEQKNPALVPEVIDLDSDPFETVKAMARKLEMPETTLRGLLDRLRSRYGPVVTEAKEVKAEILRDLFSENARRVLEAVTDEDIEKAGLRDKAVASGIYTDKHQLLSGLPTQRHTVEDRRHIDQLIVEALRVARQRGLGVDVIDVTPEPAHELPEGGEQE